MIGTICIWNINKDEESGEVGYGIIPDYQGQGLMKESLVNVIKNGFEDDEVKTTGSLYRRTQ